MKPILYSRSIEARTSFVPEPATQEEYDAQVEQRLHPQKVAVVVQSAKQAPTLKAKTLRWSCLECGAKYNGRVCPQCDGEDRILNSAKDLDPSYIGA